MVHIHHKLKRNRFRERGVTLPGTIVKIRLRVLFEYEPFESTDSPQAPKSF